MLACVPLRLTRYIPPAGSGTARSGGALEESASTAGSIRSSGQVGRGREKVGSLESHGARLSSVATIGVLEELGGAADGVGALVALLGGEILGVEGEAENELVSGEAEGEILVDSTGGTLDRGVVSGVVITTVHEIVGHNLRWLVSGWFRRAMGSAYVDKVDGLLDERGLAGDVGDHVTLKTGDSDGELLGANELLDLLEELGEGLDLVGLLGVDDLLVVGAVTTRVLQIDI